MNKIKYDKKILYIEEAKVLSRKGELKAALSSLNKVFEIDADNKQARLEAGKIYHIKGENEKAEKSLEFLFNCENIGLHTGLLLGKILNEQGKYAKALKQIDRLLLRFPKEPAIYMALLNMHIGKKDYDAAIKDLHSSLKKVDSPGWVYFELGKLFLYFKKKPFISIRYLEKAFQADPYLAGLGKDLARALMKTGKNYDSFKNYCMHIEKTPDDMEAFEELLSLYNEMGKSDKAAREIDYLLLKCNSSALYRKAGLFWFEAGEIFRAIQALKRACGLLTLDEKLILASALIENGSLKDAIGLLNKLSIKHPEHGKVNFYLGKAFYIAGKKTEAVEYLLIASRLIPFNSEVHILLGELMLEQGEFVKSIEEFKKASKLKKDVKLKLKLAKIFKRIGDYRSYIENIEDSLEMLQRKKGDLKHLTMIKIGLEKRDYALMCEAADKLRKKEKEGRKSKSAEISRMVEFIENYSEYPIETKGYRKKIPPYGVNFEWHITQECNYRCVFCVNRQKDDYYNPAAYRIYTPEQWRVVWEKIYDKYGTSRVHISGGEPSLYPDFFSIINRLSKMHLIEFDTNFSWDPDILISNVSPVGILRIGASYNPHYENFDLFIKKAVKLKKAGFKIMIQSVAYPPFLPHFEKYRSISTEYKIPFSVRIFRGYYGGKEYPSGYSEEEVSILRNVAGVLPKKSESKKIKEKQKEEIKKCRTGEMFCSISVLGDVCRCNISLEKIGNIMDENFSLIDKPQKCYIKECKFNKRMLLGEENKWALRWDFLDNLSPL